MSGVTATLSISGESFSPKAAGERLGLSLGPDSNEPGELGTMGKYKGKPTPYGSASFKCTVELADGGAFEPVCADLLPTSLAFFERSDFIPALKACGATDITLFVDVTWKDQCNLELSPTLLGALAKLGVVLAISCYEDDDE